MKITPWAIGSFPDHSVAWDIDEADHGLTITLKLLAGLQHIGNVLVYI